jgi:hypothetical protein
MKSLFDVDTGKTQSRTNAEDGEEPLGYEITRERWESWKVTLTDIQRATSNDELYARVQEVLDVMNYPEWCQGPPGLDAANPPIWLYGVQKPIIKTRANEIVEAFLAGECDESATVMRLVIDMVSVTSGML